VAWLVKAVACFVQATTQSWYHREMGSVVPSDWLALGSENTTMLNSTGQRLRNSLIDMFLLAIQLTTLLG